MKQKPKEYKNHLDRLQMSLFSMLYKKACGYLMISSYVFKDIKEKTEWGKLKNFPQAYKIIEDEYLKEVNKTLCEPNIISVDSIKADDRFGTQGARINKNMVDSYKDFVLRIGKRLKFEFNPNFSYFAGKEPK